MKLQKDFDEYQIIKRYKNAYQSLFITFALIFINGWISTDYLWAPPLTQSLIIVMIPTMYFVTRSTLQNAYLSNRVRHPLANAFTFMGVGLLNAVLIFSAKFKRDIIFITTEGQLTENVTPIVLSVFFLYIGTILLLKFLWEKRKEN